MSFQFESLFGNATLLKKVDGKATTCGLNEQLNGKYVMIYFSAHWCPPCKQFTPIFAEWYKKMTQKRQDIECVFVSSDKSQGEFDGYYDSHPWCALPFDNRQAKNDLSAKYEIRGIPSLVVVGPDGQVITKKARDMVMKDTEGAGFPWKPKTFAETLAPLKIHQKDGTGLTWADIQAKYEHVAFYFSAHWCPPCQRFTPVLASVYEKMKAKGTKAEIIYVSGDRSQAQYTEYRAIMPWAAFNYGEGKELDDYFDVSGIPTLITVKTADGSVINDEAVADAGDDAAGDNWPWKPVPLAAVASMNPHPKVLEAVNTKVCAVFHAGGGKVDDAQLDAFRAGGNKYTNDSSHKTSINFLTALEGEQLQLYDKIAQFLNLKPQSEASVVFMCLPKNKSHMVVPAKSCCASGDALAAAAETFLKTL